MDQTNIIAELYENLSTLIADGDEKGARELLRERFRELPEDAQGKILTVFLAEAVRDERREIQATDNAREEGVAAIQILESLKTSLENGPGEASSSMQGAF